MGADGYITIYDANAVDKAGLKRLFIRYKL